MSPDPVYATIADGPPGLEVSHTWNGGLGTVTLNDLTQNPRVKLTKLTGFHSLAELEDDRGPRTGRRGEVVYPAVVRGKGIVYEGAVQARSLSDLRVTAQALRLAFRQRNWEGLMTLNGQVEWAFWARVMAFDMDDEQAVGPENVWPFQRPFQLGLRMSDPRFYSTEIASVTADDGVAADATVEGSTDTDPTFLIEIINSTVTLWNVSTGAKLRFIGLPEGYNLAVQFGPRTATIMGYDMTGFMDMVYSTWWDEGQVGLHPGVNNLKVDGGNWVATWYPASE